MRFAGSPQLAGFLADSPAYDQISNAGTKARSQNRQVNHEAEGFVASSGLAGMAKIKAAQHQARATVAAAEADASATQAQGISSMIGSIAGGFGNIDFSGGGISSSGAATYAANKPAFDAAHNAFGSFYRGQ